MIELIARDIGLPDELRDRAQGMRGLATRQPDLALDRLDEMSREFAGDATYRLPTRQLAKCVSVESFFSYYLDDRVKAYFPTFEDYRPAVAADQARLMGDLRDDVVLVPKERSWLSPYSDLEALNGAQLITSLELRAAPPIIVLVLRDPPHSAVRVRTPRGTDAAIGKYEQWRPTGLASGIKEFIDHDIPSAAIGAVEWRP